MTPKKSGIPRLSANVRRSRQARRSKIRISRKAGDEHRRQGGRGHQLDDERRAQLLGGQERGPCMAYMIYRPDKLRAMAVIRPSSLVSPPRSSISSKADYGELSGTESADVPAVPGQAGADARRERPREMRRAACSAACPADAIYRGGGERRQRSGRPRYASVYQIHKTRHLLRFREEFVRSARFHGQGPSSRSTARRISSGTNKTCSCRRLDAAGRLRG